MKRTALVTLLLLIGFAAGWVSSRTKEMAEERKSTLEAIAKTRSKNPLLDATITKSLQNVEH